MAKSGHRAVIYSKTRRKQPSSFCQVCGKITDDLHQRVDDSNHSITENGAWMCKSCYIERYGEDNSGFKNFIINFMKNNGGNNVFGLVNIFFVLEKVIRG